MPSDPNTPKRKGTRVHAASGMSKIPRSVRVLAPRSITSRELMQDARMLIIHHGSEQYRLQVTLAGKLILTK